MPAQYDKYGRSFPGPRSRTGVHISEVLKDNTSVFDMCDAYDGLVGACVARSSMSRHQRPLCCKLGISMSRTSLTHPLRIDALPLAAGTLGLTFCPGKLGDSLTGDRWARDLEADLAAIKAWGAELVVTLMERHEFVLLHVPDLPERVRAHRMDWSNLPIRDVDIPAAPFDALWDAVRSDVLVRLSAGGRVVLHCRGGLGRTGLVAALLLMESRIDAEHAILAVRRARPGAIETDEQEHYVLRYRPRGDQLAGKG
jgi:protein-tyrosine phosphatase